MISRWGCKYINNYYWRFPPLRLLGWHLNSLLVWISIGAVWVVIVMFGILAIGTRNASTTSHFLTMCILPFALSIWLSSPLLYVKCDQHTADYDQYNVLASFSAQTMVSTIIRPNM